MDLQGLQLEVDGVTRSWADWTSHYVDSYYPRVGQDCYRVPAVHFNQQKLTRGDTSWGDTFHVLHPPQASVAVGDLAHTLVLERLDELSQQLRDRDSNPLFIVSSVEYDNYLARLQRRRSRRKQRKTSTSKDTKTSCSAKDEVTRKDSEGKECKGKPLLPPKPADRGTRSGEIDVLLLHERCGVVLVETKSTGFPRTTWSPAKAELHTAIRHTIDKAAGQLTSGRDTVHYIMPDLHLQQVTLVVALPYVTWTQLMEVMSAKPDSWPDLRFLCQDDLSPMATDAAVAATLPSHSTGRCSDQSRDCSPSLLAWWDGHMSAVDGALGLDTMRTIVGRICGLMSIVSVWTNSKPRVEVRTTSQAVGETGRRMSDIVLLPRQAALLAHPSLSRLYLTGPMGSGKTLLLQLKGRQWVREGRRVVVINARTIARGRPIGHVLEEALQKEVEIRCCGSVYRHDVALETFSMDALHKKLAADGPLNNVCFIVDELLSEMSNLSHQLTQQYPHSPIWCVASYVTPVPKTFRRVRLQAVLRNPPSVQLLLKELDLNPDHGHAYTTRSATRGLPCDGPPVIFIQHSKHHAPVRHLDCDQCAEELADIFEKKLGLKLRPPTLESEEQQLAGTASQPQPDPVCGRKEPAAEPQTAGNDFTGQTAASPPSSMQPRSSGRRLTRSPAAVQAAPLNFQDVLILFSLPFNSYKHIIDYNWDPSLPDVLKYAMYMGKSRFLSGLKRRGVPFRAAVDNTMKEIAFPSKDEIIITDFLGAHSLERKVVVFLRGGPPLTPEEVAENCSRYKTMPGTLQLQGETATSNSNGQQLGESLSKDMMRFASMMYEFKDEIYPELPTLSSPHEKARVILQMLFSNTMGAKLPSYMEGKTCSNDQSSKEASLESSTPQASPLPLRIGMEIRAKLPMLPFPSSTPENEKVTAHTSQDDEYLDEEGEADSMFLVPDVHEDLGGREDEVRRLQQALAQLSEDDKDWEFFAASRCLSQYISILP